MRFHRNALIAALGLLGLFSAVGLRAAESFQDPRWALLDTAQVLSNANTITLQKYPDCDDATVEDRKVQVYQPDGTGEAQEESFTKILTEKGKRENRTLNFSFTLPYYTVEVVKAEIIKPDGKVIPIDLAANSKESIDDSQMGSNIYDPNSKVLRVNLPGLEIGDVVHQVTRTHTQRPFIPGEFADQEMFEYTGLIRHATFEVYAPAEKPLKRIALKDEVAGTVTYTTQTETNGATLHRWEVREVPRMFEEPEMPPHSMVLQRLLISTSPDWQFVSKWYSDLCEPHLQATTPGMKEKVEALTAGATNDMQKIEAIFHYVSQDVRYMGITVEKDRPGFEPHDVCMTFDNKYGVCRDKAALLVSMLRLAGLKAYPVLVSAGQRLDDEVPTPFFNHAISAVELEPGKYVLMDSTDENTKDLLPSYLCHQSYLVCKPDGDALRLSPVIPAEDNMMRVKTTATLDVSGRLAGTSEMTFEGINDNLYRQGFARAKPEEIRHYFEGRLKIRIPGAQLTSFKLEPENLMDTSQAIRVKLGFTADGTVALGGGQAVTTLPMIGEVVGAVNYLLQGTGLEKRKYPLQIASTCGIHEDIILQTGPGFTNAVSLPSSTPVISPTLEYRYSTDYRPGRLTASRDFRIQTVEFSPAEYLELKHTLKDMAYDQRKSPIIAVNGEGSAAETRPATKAAAPVPSDVEILDSRKTIEVSGGDSTTVRLKSTKRVLTYSGKKSEAELKIAYNPGWQEAKLLKAVVISPSGQRQEAVTNEINIMDAPWSASAKRYTGGKIMVVSLPGVDIGSTIETEYQVVSKHRPFIGGYEGFQLQNAVRAASTELIVPANIKVRRVLDAGNGVLQESRNTAGNTQSWLWSATNIAALPSEPGAPQPWTFLPGVIFYVGDAGAYWGRLESLLSSRSQQDRNAAAKAKELAAGAKSQREAAVAIRDFVARSIRTAGPGFLELPLEELSAADVTLADGYGHNADKAILLHAMLRAAGFKPEFVAVSPIEDVPSTIHKVKSIPMPQLFGAILVRVKVDGEVCYLNDTDQYAQLGSVSASGRFAVRLADRSYEFVQPTREGRDQEESLYRLRLDAKGNARLTVTRRYYGALFNERHRYFAELPPEERRRYYQEAATGLAQGARPVGELVTRFDTYPGVEELTVDIDQYAVLDGGRLLFQLPYRPAMRWSGMDHRTLPLLTPLGPASIIRTEIEWPKDYSRVVIAPRSEKFSAPDGAGKARIISEPGSPGQWTLTQQSQKEPAIVEAADYPKLMEMQSDLERLSRRTFLLEQH
ncbi:MAG: DUF3857 domain-containing protein [Verrucomicrobiota bacterium]